MKATIVLCFIAMISGTACTNSADDKTIPQDSTMEVIVDSNATIPDTNAYFNPRPDTTNLPDEPGPTISPDSAAR